MRRYLLDTNTLTDLIRQPAGRVATVIGLLPEGEVVTSAMVAAELRFGAEKRGSPTLARQIETVLADLVILPFAPPADAIYARIRASLERQGTPIGGNDLLIAATALAHDAILVTHNTREFARVDDLRLEDWLA